jgi:hypothetical protein
VQRTRQNGEADLKITYCVVCTVLCCTVLVLRLDVVTGHYCGAVRCVSRCGTVQAVGRGGGGGSGSGGGLTLL